MTARGLEAVLTRTKTTGPGKRISELPLVVGFESYLREPAWLAVGWDLWKAKAPYVRDYFLVKPAASLDATLPVELSYEQSSRLSRAVLAGLPRASDMLQALGEPVVGLFTQHSARCWLTSLAALTQVPDADLAFLGRWAPTTAKGYVRTATEVILKVQTAVAFRLRAELLSPADAMLGEQSAYLEMRRELRRRLYDEKVIDAHFVELQAWTLQLALETPERPPLWEPLAAGSAALGAEEAAEKADGSAGEVEAGDAAPAPPTPPYPLPSGASAVPPLPVEEPAAGPPSAGYVVSLSRTNWRRLHRIGGCSRHPGVHYLRFELLGLERPQPDDYDDYCRQCWKTGAPEEPSDEEDSETDQDEGDAPLLVEEPDAAQVSGALGDL